MVCVCVVCVQPSSDFYREMVMCSSGLRDPGQSVVKKNLCEKINSVSTVCVG